MCSLAGQRFGRGAKPRVAVLFVHGGSNAFRAEAAEVASNAVTPAAANTDPSVPRDFDQAGASEISEVARSCERAGARAICQQAIGERCCAVQATKDIVPAIARKVGDRKSTRLNSSH